MGATVYAVASGKGGVGKTTTTVNLGTALAGAGNRVALVDADLGMANLARFVSLSADGVTLHEVLAGEATVEAATRSLGGNLYAVPSGADLDTYSDVETDRLGDVVDRLRDVFDHVLLDLGAGVSHETVLPLGLADGVVLVSTVDPAAIQNTVNTVDLVDRAGGEVEGVVLTRLREDDAADVDAIAARFPCPLLATIPEDDAVRRSIRAGRPVVVEDPQGPAARAYLELAGRIAAPDGDGDGGTQAGGRPPTEADGSGGDGRDDDGESPASLDIDFDADAS
jgi:septum site-determining protein MinD